MHVNAIMSVLMMIFTIGLAQMVMETHSGATIDLVKAADDVNVIADDAIMQNTNRWFLDKNAGFFDKYHHVFKLKTEEMDQHMDL